MRHVSGWEGAAAEVRGWFVTKAWRPRLRVERPLRGGGPGGAASHPPPRRAPVTLSNRWGAPERSVSIAAICDGVREGRRGFGGVSFFRSFLCSSLYST